ncbi:MAG: PD-(D/E)XK nuclease family protein [Parcubacteria group bacterium]|nr:PD-(D/E)XK nuclease family protein [Parcubacteria group bacterium]
MRTQLGFQLYKKAENSVIPAKAGIQKKNSGGDEVKDQLQLLDGDDELPKLITGHIDLLQVRNGAIHILDYKGEGAAKARPIEQLTLYALALSRLTGLRLFHFKCAWFDENDYFEFFPLHVVYKRGAGRKRIKTIEGVYNLNEKINKIENLRPMA